MAPNPNPRPPRSYRAGGTPRVSGTEAEAQLQGRDPRSRSPTTLGPPPPGETPWLRVKPSPPPNPRSRPAPGCLQHRASSGVSSVSSPSNPKRFHSLQVREETWQVSSTLQLLAGPCAGRGDPAAHPPGGRPSQGGPASTPQHSFSCAQPPADLTHCLCLRPLQRLPRSSNPSYTRTRAAQLPTATRPPCRRWPHNPGSADTGRPGTQADKAAQRGLPAQPTRGQSPARVSTAKWPLAEAF